jgi:SAM-dependent methyltransferase
VTGAVGRNARRLTTVVERLLERHETKERQARLEAVGAILASKAPPRPIEDDRVFADLQREYPPRDEYRYDDLSVWSRGVERAERLLRDHGLDSPGEAVLEGGCGDGMVGAALASYGHEVVLTDQEDWRDERSRPLTFLQGPLEGPLPVEDNRFSLVYSYNTFEHVQDPRKALAELLRVCRPGRLVYLEFGPLFASPWGLHAYRTIHAPYAQFLFSETFLEEKLTELGVVDLGGERSGLQPLNRWRPSQFEDLWRASGAEIVRSELWVDESELRVIERFPQAFAGRGLSVDDVTRTAAVATLRKGTAS